MTQRRRVALKYCGGCNPGFDRVEYFRKVQRVAGDSIEWVTLEDPGYGVVLLIQGCQTACPERTLGSVGDRGVVSIRSDEWTPEEVVKRLCAANNELGQNRSDVYR